ncbi:beta-lactamase/transpeptidase-like protein [Hesseltinella vesiculosa]|uniref:Beta-lactamase/transpeptidase-like protein n=1 Tax=Hesseltinella vesiculosa TaxID=101127 RepID=A0A1X2GUL4_9FUNG|nr:beta-lactamase/transpeptidase-like protein [Hesseltinella vesiculosa]
MPRWWTLTGVGLVGLIAVLVNIAQHQLEAPFLPWTCTFPMSACPASPMQGYVHPDYTSVKNTFADQLARGKDLGAGLAVYVRNELVIDLHGGWQSMHPRTPYTNDTLQLVYSSTKVLTAMVVAQFVQKGLLDYDATVATYWPEFAQGNKENVTLADLMQHAGGVGFMDAPLDLATVLDTEKFSALLARQPHNFQGSRVRAYHSMTLGWYVNELIRRVDPQGRTLGQFIQDDFNVNHGVEWHLKHNEALQSRFADHFELPAIGQLHDVYQVLKNGLDFFTFDLLLKHSKPYKTFINTMPDQDHAYHINNPKHRQYEGPSFNGYTNAVSMAKLAAMMANQGQALMAEEPDLLDKATFATAAEVQPVTHDVVIRMTMPLLKMGVGVFDLPLGDGEMMQFRGWSGAGGSLFFWNDQYQIGFGYTTNALIGAAPDSRTLPLLQQVVQQAKKSL